MHLLYSYISIDVHDKMDEEEKGKRGSSNMDMIVYTNDVDNIETERLITLSSYIVHISDVILYVIISLTSSCGTGLGPGTSLGTLVLYYCSEAIYSCFYWCKSL